MMSEKTPSNDEDIKDVIENSRKKLSGSQLGTVLIHNNLQQLSDI